MNTAEQNGATRDMTTVQIADAERLLITTDDAAARLGIHRSTLYDLIRTRKLKTVKIGARRLVRVSALEEAIQLLEEETAA
ncbi:helix-turn-helix domain-containing protein [Kribbella sp. VKM Ac-2566]|uniref:helix-turn-helix domain-containing protein n=1 Tax=Kribbella sp. VKM Ac-2566 TaxID=2512218 RepID=UPI0010E0C1F1|nr:helix-turn-helix domain-containing protein [Kribbella sp. VKM Ac-2566]TDW98072.1 AlpA family transcriptional regulator [Kribbella sp. VKM Ac-2566]